VSGQLTVASACEGAAESFLAGVVSEEVLSAILIFVADRI